MLNVTETRWSFYESMENGSRESMADYFETLFHHYQNRGKRIKSLLKNYANAKTNKDLTATQQVASPKSATQTSLNPNIIRDKGEENEKHKQNIKER